MGVLAVVLAVAAPALAVDIVTVPVGNAGNAGEWSGSGGASDPNRICGAVDYTYNIGKYEVMAGQYTEFLNAVADTDTYHLYDLNMWSESYGCKIQRSGSPNSYTYSIPDANYANRPVNWVTWGDAARFCNWLHNGQPTGAQDLSTTEDGSYYINGAMSDANLMLVSRETDATYAIPSEDEWYKAAYHKNDGVTGNYFDYPTSSDSVPSNDLIDPDPGNNATFSDVYHDPGYSTIGSPYYRTEVGAHENSGSPYGTFDQGGNVWEWNEARLYSATLRGLRAGSFLVTESYMHAYCRLRINPSAGYNYIGFRVVLLKPTLYVLVAPHPEWGYVTVEPNLPWYEPNATVTLTATLTESGKMWTGWAGDVDPNDIYTNPLIITMDTSKTITTGFKCGTGTGPFLPMIGLGLLGMYVIRRRRA